MKNRLLLLADYLRSSYWVTPALMSFGAFILSILSIRVDETIGFELKWITGLVYVDSPEGARSVLSTIASSMITIAGTIFSLTMVVFSLTSQQFGSLVLSNFMRDRGNQFVLGTFTATFLYCLLILRTIRGVEDSIFIPHISVLIGLGLAILSLAVLIYFIHHVSDSIRSSTVIDRVADSLNETIDDMFPVHIGKNAREANKAPDEEPPLPDFEREGHEVRARQSGYLQLIDDEWLMDIAEKHDLVIRLHCHPGNFIMHSNVLAEIWSPRPISRRVDEDIRETYVLGSKRTHQQDVEFLFEQLVQIAVRALSPAINDPITAMMCVDRLGEGISELSQRQIPSRYRYDDEGNLRVITQPITFKGIIELAFTQIRHYGAGDIRVVDHLLDTIFRLAQRIDDPELLYVLRQQAAWVRAEGLQGLPDETYKEDSDRHYRAALEALQEKLEQVTTEKTKSRT
jgi:uncharacterized membrane protein